MRQATIRAAFTVGSLLIAGSAPAQSGKGAVVGIVRDSAGGVLRAVRVAALHTGVESVTDDSGAFRLTGLPSGAILLEARRVGYFADTQTVVLALEETKVATIVLSRLSPDLLPLVVVDGTMRRGKMAGFEGRRARGVGTFITRDDIEQRHPLRVSEMLRYLPGVSVPQESSDQREATVSMGRSARTSMQGNCAVQLYVDGLSYAGGHLDDFPPVTVEGIEVYRSASQVPATFRGRDSMCGVIALWTRDPVAARRRAH